MSTKPFRVCFNGKMVLAVLQGRKTTLRLPVLDQREPVDTTLHYGGIAVKNHIAWFNDASVRTQQYARMPCAPGDVLIGREACVIFDMPMTMGHVLVEYRADKHRIEHHGSSAAGPGVIIDFASDLSQFATREWKTRPANRMPDAVARIRRRVVSVKAERVQDVTIQDAVREGFPTDRHGGTDARNDFLCAWDDIYLNRGLASAVNPWVWRIEFGTQDVLPGGISE